MAQRQAQNKPKSAPAKRCPLRRHRTGQWYKKIRGKFYYFGTHKQKALQAYYEQASDLHAPGEAPPAPVETSVLTLRTLCNLYLTHQESRVKSGEITAPHFATWHTELRAFAKYLGFARSVEEIVAMDLQKYRAKLIRAGYKPRTINLKFAAVRALFHWAEDNDVIEKGPNLRAVKRVNVTKRKQRDERRTEAEKRQTFTPEEIRRLLEHAEVQMRAMIWLGLNCAFGNTDVAELRWDDLDLEKGQVSLPRGKTGVRRNLTLWPETLAALREVPRQGPLVFYTKTGKPWVRLPEGSQRRVDRIVETFAVLLRRAGIDVQKGTGFYTLRRTAATIAAQSGDVFAVQGLLGHTDTKMASVYVQSVSTQTDKAVMALRTWLTQKPLVVEDS
ncbi:MAG: tyrosine-type recombinase/integrase, partial [Desulfobacterales bacterium]|nr:tyrosine-type recombinase/integrase [Desulfobacterales bacterium]